MNFEKLVETDLLSHEGFKSSVYQDHIGFLTIGIGRMVDARRGGGITFEEAMILLKNDVRKVVADLRKELPWFSQAPTGVQRALVNMAFQMGVNGVLGFKNTLTLIKQEKYKEAAENALKSKWAKQTPARAREVCQWIADCGQAGHQR